MTLIIWVKWKDWIYLWSDWLTISWDTVYDIDSQKIKIINWHAFWCAWYASTKELMSSYLERHKLKKPLDILKIIEYMKDKVDDIQFSVIITIGNGLYVFDNTGYIKEVTTHHCIGSWEDMWFILMDWYDETIDMESYIKYTIDKVSKRCVSVWWKILTLKIPYENFRQVKNIGIKKPIFKKKH